MINAHPKVDSNTSVSLQVLNHFLNYYQRLNPEGPVEQVNLYQDYIPKIDHHFLQAMKKSEKREPFNEEEQKIMARLQALVDQFKDAKKYVIAMPLHNFNIPSN